MDKNQPEPIKQPDQLVTVYRLRDDIWAVIKDYLNSLPWSQTDALLVRMFDQYDSSPHYTKQGIETLTSFLRERPRAEVKDLMLALAEEDALQAYSLDPSAHETQPETEEDTPEATEPSAGGEPTQEDTKPKEAKEEAKKKATDKK